MKKTILTSLVLAASVSAFAYDFGGSFANISKIANLPDSDGVLKLDQKDSVSAWFKTPFGSSTTNYFLIDGKYQFEWNPAESETINAIDIDVCKGVYVEDEFTITAGRFVSSDLSGLIYNQAGDGCSIYYELPLFNATGYGFYTGLLNDQFTTIIDQDFKKDSSKVYELCPGYIVTGAQGNLPYFLGEQSLGAELIYSAKLEPSKRAHTRLYAEGSLNGPLFINGLYYNVTGVLGFEKLGSGDFKMGNLSTGSVSYYPDFYGMCISAESTYASGNNGPFDCFTGFTSQTAVNSLAEPEWTGLFVNGINASIKPISNLLVTAGADIVTGTKNCFKFDGFQYKAGADWQIYSDIYAGAELTQYFDADNSDNNKTAITLRVIVTF